MYSYVFQSFCVPRWGREVRSSLLLYPPLFFYAPIQWSHLYVRIPLGTSAALLVTVTLTSRRLQFLLHCFKTFNFQNICKVSHFLMASHLYLLLSP